MNNKQINKVESLLTDNNITANVFIDWNRETNRNCKFVPGDSVKVSAKRRQLKSIYQQDRRNETGQVIAVTCSNDINIRASNRGTTRYYVKFNDNAVVGFDSYLLKQNS